MAILCFGFSYKQIGSDNFNYTLHYFDSELAGAIEDIPSSSYGSLYPFQNSPDMYSYSKWVNSGYLLMMKIINEAILQVITSNTNSEINFVVMAQKYYPYKYDEFVYTVGFILPFFILIAYVCPLSLLVYRMVKEKETKIKEEMKIMGLKEYIYFLSFFLQWLVLNTIYSVINSLILTQVLHNTSFLYILAFFWLFGMCVFSMAYFFQSLMDKTRIALIIAILIYFIMFFVAQAVISDTVPNSAKIFISLLPPTALQLGILVLCKFDSNFIQLGSSQVKFSYGNYSVGNMYLMLFIDIFLYLVLGYFFDHIVHHQYGIRSWCKKKNNKESAIELNKIENDVKYHVVDFETETGEKINNNSNGGIPIINQDSDYFQSEHNYEERIKSGDCLKIRNLKKTFDDGKIAVNGLNLNLYKNEIFALLGHNGAGKSTIISIMCGLYEATSGSAFYKNADVLQAGNMDNFRKKLGICPQHDVLFEDLSVREHLRFFSVFKDVESSKLENEIEKTLTDMQLGNIQDELVKNFSGGQKRKLSIAIALIGGSEVVILDEPSSGMDITSRRNLWELLKKCSENRIIVLTTHYMEEAAILGNRIGIVFNGKLKCCGNSLFLIDRLGKYISLDIDPKKDAIFQDIVKFVRDRIPNVIVDISPEKIAFRIPKTLKEKSKTTNEIMNEDDHLGFNLKGFFNELDANLTNLSVKSYGLSMPTLEDVFLNTSAENNLNHRFNKVVKKMNVNHNNRENYSALGKLVIDLKSSIKKRFLQILRDKNAFLLEIFCPIILVLIGLVVSSFQNVTNSSAITATLDQMGPSHSIIINTNMFPNDVHYNTSFIYQPLVLSPSNYSQNIIDYNNIILDQGLTNSYGSFLILNFNNTNNVYEFVTFSNTFGRNAPVIYSQYMLNKIHSLAAGRNIKVNHSITPFPLTNIIKKQGQNRNNLNLVFFVSIAFALIPADFITIIIKERESNTKHLQIISGISLISYWLSNFIFELLKYYFIGGINLLLILAFKMLPSYLWVLYLFYGFAMTSFTYMFSLIFSTESSAQNAVILINFLFGALGGTVVIMLRVLKDFENIGKIIAYVMRIVPSFAFSYGFNELLSAQLLYYVDNPNSPQLVSADSYILNLNYAGLDCLYLGAEFVFYLLILILFEKFRNSCSRRKTSYSKVISNSNVNDSIVMQEIEKANREGEYDNYSIKVKNLEKVYKRGIFSKTVTKAVDNLSFCLESGECFAVLGVNGAGKTTTFKALAHEHVPTGGEIYINGIDIFKNFNKVKNLIGYCPQYDAIFDYMTVRENLEFYANIKGLKQEDIKFAVTDMISEMNLSQYVDKLSGNLSGGNKRKLSVAIAIIGNPPIVLLDEPSTGLDPEARRFMWDVISNISKKNKFSSVILTTNSMEEAENLCRRIGIMVDGQFKCLGTSQSIKDKYGFGYELDLRIKIVPQQVLIEYLRISNINPYTLITDLDGLKKALNFLKKEEYFALIESSKLGRGLKEEVNYFLINFKISNGLGVTNKKLIEWIFYSENFLKSTQKILDYFDDVYLIEHVVSNFKLKIKKNSESVKNPTNGFIFSLIEYIKDDCFISEFSISQSNLEHIFNKFALEKGENVIDDNIKKEMMISKELIRSLNII